MGAVESSFIVRKMSGDLLQIPYDVSYFFLESVVAKFLPRFGVSRCVFSLLYGYHILRFYMNALVYRKSSDSDTLPKDVPEVFFSSVSIRKDFSINGVLNRFSKMTNRNPFENCSDPLLMASVFTHI